MNRSGNAPVIEVLFGERIWIEYLLVKTGAMLLYFYVLHHFLQEGRIPVAPMICKCARDFVSSRFRRKKIHYLALRKREQGVWVAGPIAEISAHLHGDS